ncbi:hypothetical protein GO001_33555 [Streptomyces sp. NRRL B-1677]|uniref:ATP-binding protein n=1 Tax=Streptomyces klenkii TaxID=1420899 RepID=A0A3B0AGC9_9ACTN|nr:MULTISPECIES: hypothetical protein [Streptomyces]MBF6050047.1 hypothetical protein [Streptomyces sp. NRRL B-1677]RKN59650.1 hypothetical protein D7231_34225 [Streptomyces klenkii]
MSTGTLSNPSTTTHDAGESYVITAPAFPPTARVLRDSVRAMLSGTFSELTDDARLCVSDAVTYILRSKDHGPTVTMCVCLYSTRLTIAVEDAAAPSRLLYTLSTPDMGAERQLTLMRRLAYWAGVSRTWDGTRRATRVFFELSTEGTGEA